MSDDKLMTISEVAEYLRCTEKQVGNFISNGKLRYYKAGHTKVFSYVRHVQPYLASIEKGKHPPFLNSHSQHP